MLLQRFMMNGIQDIRKPAEPVNPAGGQIIRNNKVKIKVRKSGKNGILAVRLGISVLLCVCELLLKFPLPYNIILYGLAFLTAGADCLLSFIKSILRLDFSYGPLFISLAGVTAMAAGMYAQGVFLIILFRSGELIADYILRALDAGYPNGSPDAVIRRAPAGPASSAGSAAEGDTAYIKPGGRVPFDGVVISGKSMMDTSAVTGEELPRMFSKNDRVLRGFISLSGTIQVKAAAPLSRAIDPLVPEPALYSAGKCSRTEVRVSGFADFFTIFAFIAALLAVLIPPVFFNADWREWLGRALVFLAVARPISLCLSVSAAYSAAISGAAENGIFPNGSASLNALARMNTIVFDKTGTLSTGRYKVASVEPEQISIHTLLMINAYALNALMSETQEEDPLAEAVIGAYDGHIDSKLITKTRVFPGKGVCITVKNIDIVCGNASMMEQLGIETGDDSDDECVLYTAVSGKYAGRLLLTDPLKEDASSAVFQLQKLGVNRIIMLTGDKEHTARKLAGALGIGECRSECLQEDKKQVMEQLRRQNRKSNLIAYVGNAAKDPQIFELADVGISVGTSNMPDERDISGLIIPGDSPVKIVDAVSFARKTESIVKQNIAFTVFFKLLIMTLGIFGISPLWFAAFLDAGVLILASLNAVKAKQIKA